MSALPSTSADHELARLSIAALVVRAQDGCIDAYGEIVRRFEPRLFNFLRHRLRSLEDVEDTTQEAFLRAWTNIQRYDDRWQFSTWLFTIGTRLAIGVNRKRRPELGGAWTEREASTDRTPDVAAEHEERTSNLWRFAEEHLNETERTALWLRHAEDLPITDIARILERSPVAVRVLMHRARRKLAEVLDDPADETTPQVAAARDEAIRFRSRGVTTDA